MSVAYELKQKRAALTDRLQQLDRERVDLQELMRALDRVILSYEPDYQGWALTGPEQGNRSRKAKPSSASRASQPISQTSHTACRRSSPN